MTGFMDSSTPCGCQGNRTVVVPTRSGFGIVTNAGHAEPGITGDMTPYPGMRGLGDLTTLGADLANGDIAAVFSDLLPYIAGAAALYLVYYFVFKGSGGGSSRRRRLSQARELANYEIAKARVGA